MNYVWSSKLNTLLKRAGHLCNDADAATNDGRLRLGATHSSQTGCDKHLQTWELGFGDIGHQ